MSDVLGNIWSTWVTLFVTWPLAGMIVLFVLAFGVASIVLMFKRNP